MNFHVYKCGNDGKAVRIGEISEEHADTIFEALNADMTGNHYFRKPKRVCVRGSNEPTTKKKGKK